jgi:hypothetical protein
MMSAPRKIAIKLMSAVVRYSPDESREWASAMLQELDFVEGDWAALFWALGCTTAIFRHSSDRLWIWLGKQFGFKEDRMNDFQKRAVGVISGVGIAVAVTACLLAGIHLSGDPERIPWVAWAVIAGLMEAAFAIAAIVLWRKRRPMAVGILLSAVLLGTHFVMHLASTHGSH